MTLSTKMVALVKRFIFFVFVTQILVFVGHFIVDHQWVIHCTVLLWVQYNVKLCCLFSCWFAKEANGANNKQQLQFHDTITKSNGNAMLRDRKFATWKAGVRRFRNTPVPCSNIHISVSTLNVVQYSHSLSALISDVNVVPSRILCGLLTGNYDCDCRNGSSPAINIPL